MTAAELGRSRARALRPLILMVEDSAEDRRIYGSMLCYNGFDVVLAPSGMSALRHLPEHEPNLILLDLGLPGMSGLRVAEEIRRTHSARIPIVALSGFRESSLGRAARAAGCTLYLEKPISPVAVLHEIEALVGHAPPPGEGVPPVEIELS